MPIRAFVLWDIDGTLVDSAKLGRDAFLDAYERVTGRPPAHLVPFAGRTDLEIAADMLGRGGFGADDGMLESFHAALAAAMAARAGELGRRGRAYAGAEACLARLQGEHAVLQSLLTGNIEPNARVKLGAFGLDRYVDFDIGGFGSDHRVRSELVAVACDRAERKHGRRISRTHVVLVGDTPLDVDAAKAAGARAVGVATGPFPAKDLRAAGADAVLADLRDTEQVIAAVLGG